MSTEAKKPKQQGSPITRNTKRRTIYLPPDVDVDMVEHRKSLGIESESEAYAEAAKQWMKSSYIRVVGHIHAGEPSETDEEQVDRIECSVLPGGDSYGMVKVYGDSLDKVLPEGAWAHVYLNGLALSGKYVAATIEFPQGPKTVIKRFEQTPDCAMLRCESSNKKNKDIVICDDGEEGERDGKLYISGNKIKFVGVWTGGMIVSAITR